jgi:hypothetical protein
MAKKKGYHRARKVQGKKGWIVVWMKDGVAKGKSRRFSTRSAAEKLAKSKRSKGFGARILVQMSRKPRKKSQKKRGVQTRARSAKEQTKALNAALRGR